MPKIARRAGPRCGRWTVAYSLLLSCSLFACAGVQRPAAGWWTYQADIFRTGSAAGVPLTPPLALAWNVTLPEDIGGGFRPPVFGSRKVIVSRGLNPGAMYALSLSDGAILWSHPGTVVGNVTHTLRDAPAVADGRVYAALGSSLSPGGRVIALNETDGTTRWSRDMDAIPYASILVAYTSAYVLTHRRRVDVFHTGNGMSEGVIELPGESEAMFSAPSFAAGMLMVAGHKALHAVRRTRERPWRFDYPRELIVVAPVAPLRAGPDAPATVIVAGVVLNDTEPPHDDVVAVHAVNAYTGSAIWSVERPVDYTNNMAFAVTGQGAVIVLAGTHVFALAETTGDSLWTHRTTRRLQFAPATSGGTLYFTDGVKLHALRMTDGSSIWSADLPVTDPLWRGGLAIDQGLLVIGHEAGAIAFRAN